MVKAESESHLGLLLGPSPRLLDPDPSQHGQPWKEFPDLVAAHTTGMCRSGHAVVQPSRRPTPPPVFVLESETQRPKAGEVFSDILNGACSVSTQECPASVEQDASLLRFLRVLRFLPSKNGCEFHCWDSIRHNCLHLETLSDPERTKHQG